MLHLSPSALQTVLEKILELAATAQKAHYFLNGLTSELKLGTVVEALVFKTKQILDRFTAELSDLQLICLFQSGQINRSQLRLQSGSKLADQLQLPLTLLRFHELVEGELFVKVQTVYDVVSNGVMDFLVAQKDQQNHNLKHFQMRMFQDQQALKGQPGEKAGQPDRDISFTGAIKELKASLDVEKIKPADRVSFLLNYLYLVLRNNQLVFTSCPEQISLLREIFVATLDPYVQILSQWVTKGELNDPYGEFFIKVNPKLEQEDQALSAREQWEKSFKFRSINLREFEDRLFGLADDGQLAASKIEISIPIFLRAQI